MGWRRELDSVASGGGMKTLSRRKVLMTLLAIPVAAMLPRTSLGAPRVLVYDREDQYSACN